MSRQISLNEATRVEEVISRLARLQPTSTRRWGKMTPSEMLCHLADSYLLAMGERPFSPAESVLSRTLMRWVALHTPLKWPQGIPTRPEVDPHREGTKPEEFERDREYLAAVLRRFAGPGATYGRHPGFGTLTRDEWLIWGYRHADHHLRQFGL